MNNKAGNHRKGQDKPMAREQTLLPLVSLLLNRLLTSYRLGKWMLSARVEVEAVPEGLLVWLNVAAGEGLVQGRYPVEFRIEDTSPEQTEFSMHLKASGGVAGVVKFIGKNLLPREFINERLQEILGDAIRLEGERFILSHAALIQRLSQPAPGQPMERPTIT